jgi:hypothetical protein
MTGDLFGGPDAKPRGKHYVAPRGYAAPPGTGPAGETCGTCKHAHRYVHFAKCGHSARRHFNTNGAATDIRLRTAACSKWESAAGSGCDHCGDHPDGLGDGAPCPSCGKGTATSGTERLSTKGDER